MHVSEENNFSESLATNYFGYFLHWHAYWTTHEDHRLSIMHVSEENNFSESLATNHFGNELIDSWINESIDSLTNESINYALAGL